jgi:predicted dehydrogenase
MHVGHKCCSTRWDVDKVHWGIIGTGAVAELFARGLLTVEGAILQGVASRAHLHAGDFANRFGARRAYATYTELLHDSAIDIVYVATRNQHHHADALAAINAGKGVLCEKPFTLNADQAREVAQAARRRGVFCMEAMWMRFSPAVRDVLRIVRTGKIGSPIFVSAQLGFPIRFDPLDRVFAAPGGGALFDYGVYPLSFAHALLGRPAQISSVARIGPTGVDEHFTAVLQYQSGCHAVIAASLRSQLGNAAAIHGTDGVLDTIGPLYFPKGYCIQETPPNDRRPDTPRRGIGTLPRRAWSRFRRVVLGRGGSGRAVRCDVVNGYAEEATAVQLCLCAGQLESADMTLDETIAVMESMDAIREQWLPQYARKTCALL